jgi:chromosome partitioning protein
MIFAVFNNKGGSGKTATSVNLAAAMATMGRKVLLIDLDAQCNGSLYAACSDWSKDQPDQSSIYDLLFSGADPRSLARSTAVENLFCIPSSVRMQNASSRLAQDPLSNPALKLYAAIRKSGIRNDYDHIVIDCPSEIDLVSANALNAADYCIIPAFADTFSTDGIEETLNAIETAADNGAGSEVELLGVVVCNFRAHTTVAKTVEAEIREALPGAVFNTTIRQAAAVPASISKDKKPLVLAYAKDKVTEEYALLAREVMTKVGG